MDKVNFEDMSEDFEFDTPAEPVEEQAEEEVVEEEESSTEISKELKDDFNRVYDALLFEGKYEKVYKLGKKYSAVFSTRSTGDDSIVSRKLDAMKFQTVAAYNNMASIFTLAYSLVEYNGKDFRKMDATSRYEEITKLPSPVIELLSAKMIDFDQLVRGAMNYGSENF